MSRDNQSQSYWRPQIATNDTRREVFDFIKNEMDYSYNTIANLCFDKGLPDLMNEAVMLRKRRNTVATHRVGG
jgi:hypothetical protein